MNLDATKKHIVLLKLVHLHENFPALVEKGERQLIASASALLKLYDRNDLGVAYDKSMRRFRHSPMLMINAVRGHIVDAIERIRLELELEGRSEIGTAYGPGEVYRYFADLKQIVGGATKELLIVDPYFNGEAFDNYLAGISNKVTIRLFLEHNRKEVSTCAGKHHEQYGTEFELRSSKRLHDRVIFVDRDACWISGGSVKDGGQKPTYLIPLAPSVAEKKLRIYEELWTSSKPIDLP